MSANSTEASWSPHQDNRRKHERIFEKEKQLRLVIDDGTLVWQKLLTINWSAGGCLIFGPPGFEVGDTVAGTLVSCQGDSVVTITAEILRIDDDGRAALCFTTVGPP
jgi:hypothetical protein|tara:strand:- start:428 stop:748 length:321 start_codon:yes stop_codon:yes gene_type:complete